MNINQDYYKKLNSHFAMVQHRKRSKDGERDKKEETELKHKVM